MQISSKLGQQAIIFAKKERAMKRRERFYKRQARERMLFALTISLAMVTMFSSPRVVWTKERGSQWWEQAVMSSFTHHDWLHNFRMSRETFLYACNELKNIDTDMRKAIPLQQRIAIALWFLSTNADYRTIGHLFGVSKAAICLITKEVCAFIVDLLLPKYIYLPRG